MTDLDALDRDDPLAAFPDRFDLPSGVVYLDGNSLGPLPRATRPAVDALLAGAWGRDLIASWEGNGWMAAPLRVGAAIGRLIGAETGSVIAGDSTSINLFKALAAALALRPGRTEIAVVADDFPTDHYIAGGIAGLLGRGHRLRAGAPGPETAVVLAGHVDFRTGRMRPMVALTAEAHAVGALAVWDLSHSTGAVPLALAAAGADFAVGCGYKFLNGGPGAPGYLYVAPRHQGVVPALAGWMGHAAPFAFASGYAPAQGIARFGVGTPPILGLAALEVGVGLALAADMAALREKSLRMSTIFMEGAAALGGFGCLTPADPDARGSQVCLTHPEAAAIMGRLAALGVVGDFRPPDILRFGITPLTLRYRDIGRALACLAQARGE